MSWSDPCGVCGQHRADCECKIYDDVDGKYSKNRKMNKPQTQNPRGLHAKYLIQKIVPNPAYDEWGFEPQFKTKPVDPEAEYFVLRLDDNGSDLKHIEACREAVLCYAEKIKNHLPELAEDIFKRYLKQPHP